MTKTVNDLQLDAVMLAGLIGGAEVLADAATSMDAHCVEAKMARNSLPPMFDDLRRRADALAEALERLEGRIQVREEA